MFWLRSDWRGTVSDRATEILLQGPSIVGLITKRIARCHTQARELITANQQTVEAVTLRLEQTGYLDRAAIDELLKTYPVRNSKADPSDKSDGGCR